MLSLYFLVSNSISVNSTAKQEPKYAYLFSWKLIQAKWFPSNRIRLPTQQRNEKKTTNSKQNKNWFIVENYPFSFIRFCSSEASSRPFRHGPKSSDQPLFQFNTNGCEFILYTQNRTTQICNWWPAVRVFFFINVLLMRTTSRANDLQSNKKKNGIPQFFFANVEFQTRMWLEFICGVKIWQFMSDS